MISQEISFWRIVFPVYYLISEVIYIVVFMYFTKKILNNNRILPQKKLKYILFLSCYFHFPIIFYWLISAFTVWLLLFYAVIIFGALTYLFYAIRAIIRDEYIDNSKRTFYILAASVIWVFGFFLYLGQSRATRLDMKYRKKRESPAFHE